MSTTDEQLIQVLTQIEARLGEIEQQREGSRATAARASEVISEALGAIEERQAATARAVRNLYTGLSAAESTRTGENDRLVGAESSIDAMRIALLKLVSARVETIVSEVTAEELADFTPAEVINRARAIQWARKRGEPEPLPPAPDALVPAHQHRRRGDDAPRAHEHRRKDDSIVVKTDKSGSARLEASVRMKTLLGWIIAGAVGIFEIVKAIKAAAGH